MNMTFAQKAMHFYRTLSFSHRLPGGVEVMNPYQAPTTRSYVERFLKKYYSDSNKRILVFGINPGRLGAGLTGVTFTDPVALQQHCGISNSLEQRRELSSEFIYTFIDRYGGAQKFYKKFFLTAVSPLGFVNNGINYNYYDDLEIITATKPFIIETLEAQMKFGTNRKVAIILGSGKNKKYLTALNEQYDYFQDIFVLDHPRFIMQYRRRQLSKYLNEYEKIFSEALKQ